MATLVLRFVQTTGVRNTAVLRRCWSRTSDTPFPGFRNVSYHVSGLIKQELSIILHFLAQKLEITLFGLPCGPLVGVSQLECSILQTTDV